MLTNTKLINLKERQLVKWLKWYIKHADNGGNVLPQSCHYVLFVLETCHGHRRSWKLADNL